MWDALEKFLNQFREDKNIRVVVLEGAGGKSFVSGADISKFDKERSTKEAVLSYNKRTHKVYEFLETFPKPTIAKINGYCIGGSYAWFSGARYYDIAVHPDPGATAHREHPGRQPARPAHPEPRATRGRKVVPAHLQLAGPRRAWK